VKYLVGTMIEVPRGAITAGEIARAADFFSFGTNDLTQTTFGLSRDDTGPVLSSYLEKDVLAVDPFVSIDRDGVGALMRIAVAAGRHTKPGLKLGICGEHGGDPASVAFCHALGLDYVSCSPFRLPIARLAAAQAALREAAERKAVERKAQRPATSSRGRKVARSVAASPKTRTTSGRKATRDVAARVSKRPKTAARRPRARA
jgi:pyruvate,orthophosphate dikinase